MYLQFFFSNCKFRENCTKECGIFPPLTSFNNVGGPERFPSSTLTVSGKLATKGNIGDLPGT